MVDQYFTKIGYTVKGGSGKRVRMRIIFIDYYSKVQQNGAGMYPSRDVTSNFRVCYVRVKRPIANTRLNPALLGLTTYPLTNCLVEVYLAQYFPSINEIRQVINLWFIK